MTVEPQIPRKKLEDGLDYLALIIDEHGHEYWPLFERLEGVLQLTLEREQKIRSRLPSSL